MGTSGVVTFFTGAVARELLVGVDEDARRIACTVVESPSQFRHHNASAQVVAEGDGRSRFIWITNLLPDALALRFPGGWTGEWPRSSESSRHGPSRL
jgi:hypothetical protein